MLPEKYQQVPPRRRVRRSLTAHRPDGSAEARPRSSRGARRRAKRCPSRIPRMVAVGAVVSRCWGLRRRRRADGHAQAVRADRAALGRLQIVLAGCERSDRRAAVRAGELPSDACARDRRARAGVGHPHRHGPAGPRGRRPAQREQRLCADGVGEEDPVAILDRVRAGAHRRELAVLVLGQKAPRGGIERDGLARDRREARAERVEPRAGDRDRRRDDRGAACRDGLRAGAAGRRPVALMGRRVAGELERTDVGGDGTLEQRPRGSLDPEVDRDGRSGGRRRQQRCADEAGGEAGGSSDLHRLEPPLSARADRLGSEGGLLASGPDPPAPSRLALRDQWLRPGAACGGLPR